MKIEPSVILLFIVFPTFGVCQTLIKGHYIGESVADFRKAEDIDRKLAVCRTTDAQTVSEYHISQMSDGEFQHFQQTQMANGYGSLSRKKAERLASRGEFNKRDSRSSEVEAECKSLAEGFEHGNPTSYTKRAPLTVTFTFRADKVDQISLVLPEPSFDETVIDLTRRLGHVPEVRRPKMYNATGARWDDREATWLDSSIHAKLYESNNPVRPAVSLVVKSRATYDAEFERFAIAPSPLD